MKINYRFTDGPLVLTHLVDQTNNFCSMDSEERFIKNSRKFRSNGEDWEYFNKSITYKFNSQGYRAPEWTTINWAESVVIFGCSFVLGEGLAEEDTIASQLSKILQRPVVNLGVLASSMLFSLYNSTMLYNNMPKPYAVVQNWTDINRIELYTRVGVTNNMPSLNNSEFYKHWILHPENPNTYMYMAAQTSRCMWDSKTRYYELTQFPATVDILNCTFVPTVDLARDLSHPGIESAKLVAENIAENIN
jgi:hypothetical protein